MTTPLPHAVAIHLCSDFNEGSQPCGDPNHSPESCTCLKLVRAWRKMESDLAARDAELAEARKYLRAANDELAEVKRDFGIGMRAEKAEAQLAAMKQRADAAERKAEESARDAERYRWLRSKARLEYMNPRAMEDCRMEWNFPKLFGMTCVMTEIPVDEAIDAAIAAKGAA